MDVTCDSKGSYSNGEYRRSASSELFLGPEICKNERVKALHKESGRWASSLILQRKRT